MQAAHQLSVLSSPEDSYQLCVQSVRQKVRIKANEEDFSEYCKSMILRIKNQMRYRQVKMLSEN